MSVSYIATGAAPADEPRIGRWSFRRPGIRFLFLLPAMFGGLLTPLLRAVRHQADDRLLTAVAVLIVVGVVAYGLLTWKLVIEAHRRSDIGGLFGEER